MRCYILKKDPSKGDDYCIINPLHTALSQANYITSGRQLENLIKAGFQPNKVQRCEARKV